MNARLLAVCTVALLGFAPAPFPRPDRHKVDPTAILGYYEFELWEHNGSPSKASYHIEIEKGKYHFVTLPNRGGPGNKTTYELRLDPTQTPYAFEWSMNNRVMYVGSYRMQGERLTMIFRNGQRLADRPTDFDGKPEFRFVMRRIRR